jgi:hypothetical protein
VLLLVSLITYLSLSLLASSGTGAKLGFFSNTDTSSPFSAGEKREDALYSPYSPYGNGDASAYKLTRANTPDEIAQYQKLFDESVRRTEKIPGYTAKKTWFETTTELTRYMYSMRGSMTKLASVSKNPEKANFAAKQYFSDLNDIYVFSQGKNQGKVMAAYDESVKDLAKFKALVAM